MTRRALLPVLLIGLLAGCGMKPAKPAASSAAPEIEIIEVETPVAGTYGSYTGVKADWSKAEEKTPWKKYELSPYYCDGRLSKGGYYGPLRPYMGKDNTFSTGYGLLDGEGRVLTAPCYEMIYPSGGALELGYTVGEDYRSDVVAQDGSWLRTGFWGFDQRNENSVVGYGEDGSVNVLFADGTATVFSGDEMRAHSDGGLYYPAGGNSSIVWMENGVGAIDDANGEFISFLLPETGEILDAPVEGYPTVDEYYDALNAMEYDDRETPFSDRYDSVYPIEDQLDGTVYYVANEPLNEEKSEWMTFLLDENGNELMHNENWICEIWGGWYGTLQNGCFSYYDLDGTLQFRYPLITADD